MENQPKLNSSKEVIAYLAERFPLCFIAEGEARPLKIGIFKDLVERLPNDESLSKTQLRSALRLYTSSWRYLYGVKTGAQRVDLDGNSCGELEAEHVEHARKQLEEAKARVQAHRAAQQVQKREAGETVTERRPRPAAKKANHSRERQAPKKPSTPVISTSPEQQRKAHPKSETQKPRQAVTDITQLRVGQDVRVKAGQSSIEATILEVSKDGARVQLSTGLAMIVRAEHLQF